MSRIDPKKLQNVVQKDGKTIARCPACAARGDDAKGEHLVLYPDGKFGCVVNSKDKKHNSLILELVGCDAEEEYQVPVRRVVHAPSKVIQIVGRFGRSLETAPSADTSEPKASTKIITDPAAVADPRPPRPPDVVTDGSTPPADTQPQRRPSVLDELFAAKGLSWKAFGDDTSPPPYQPPRRRTNVKKRKA